MIGKIDTKVIVEKALSPSTSIQKGEGSDFRSLLKGKMEEPIALERLALEILKKAVELALAETNPGENEFFPSLTLFSPLPISSPPRLSPPAQPVVGAEFQTGEIESDSEVSNYLLGEKDFESLVREAAQKSGVDPSLIRAVIHEESGGNPLAVSRAGARGLMQLMPETAAELGVKNPFDPAENIMGGTRYLRRLLDRYRGDVNLALAAYNWGMGNLEKRPESMPIETKNYIARVENHLRNLTRA